jgi:flagellar biogenesis protein FliO
MKVKFLLASLKTLTNSEDCSVSRIKFLFRLFFTLIGCISPVYLHGWLVEQFSESQAASRKPNQVP